MLNARVSIILYIYKIPFSFTQVEFVVLESELICLHLAARYKSPAAAHSALLSTTTTTTRSSSQCDPVVAKQVQDTTRNEESDVSILCNIICAM